MGVKAMCVDDSATIRTLVQKALTPAGFDVVGAGNGREALGASDSSIDIFIVDVHMPEMDGFEYVAAIRAKPELAAKPIVFLTTESSDQMKSRGKELGVSGWIVKPFKPSDLASVALTLTGGTHADKG